MIAHVCQSTGWTWDYIEQHMDVPRLQALNRYHQQHPPLHLLAGAWLGYTGQPAATPASHDLDAFASAFQALGGAVS